jgi:Xaa-Pro aminopeptidase
MFVDRNRGVFYKTPPFADFPEGEFSRRIETVQKHMSKRDIDVLILWDEHNIQYFCGFNTMHWASKSLQCAILVIPIKRDPIVICPGFFRGAIEATTYIQDILGYDSPHHISKLRGLSFEVAKVFIDMGYEKKRIGIEDGDLGGMYIPRPVSDIDSFRSALPAAIFVKAADIIWECRMIKSDLEIEALKTACALATDAFSEFVENFTLGMTEKEAGAYLYSAMIRRGLLPAGMYFVGNPRRHGMVDTHPLYEGVPMSRGNHVVVECFGRYKGYRGGVGRCLEIGEISDKKWEFIRATEYAQDAAIASVRDGILARDILGSMQKAFEEKGFTRSFAGHGIGLTGHEPPALTDAGDVVIRKNMVLAIETWIFDQEGFTRGGRVGMAPGEGKTNLGQFGLEEYVVVTGKGCEVLPNFPRDIRIIPRRVI